MRVEYFGEFVDGKYHGQGELNYRDEVSDCIYTGEFRNGLKHGIGKQDDQL